ncbi:MAG: glycosyltransferase family 4 protein [Rhodospirillaceae bacterium]|mgnify:FL=1|jgi:glycosyltransferase involved in cell wall biosynthesis|nr:glycosyltransferase family 4 protein [Rhodospirillaceae bacterium]MBT4773197.1 glycosyltransferase family 4 protein [Rhodospirillaceae bacterium]MBT5358378.1 glycosyltransferase family 4 protein [Rhodospirillaceae bacterium]MBT5771128.1 glycosyltransferase family 4 protein [Rhodospirillaceae bacterium]MBT6308695.1 glycosyltransferase family 4 protein [Rhodospirillaceae bacterium]
MNDGPDSNTKADDAASAARAATRDAAARETAARLPVVLQVLPSLDVGGGGVERSAIDVAEALVLAGKTAIVASSGGRQVVELERRGVRHVELPLASKNPLIIRRNIARLAELIEREQVELVHARSRAPAWSARAAARAAGLPFVTTFHGTYNFGGGTFGALKKRYNAVMADGDLVIANSRFIAAHMKANYAVPDARIRTIPRGIDTARFDAEGFNPNRMIEVATRWRMSDENAVVLLPGRLTRWKGQLLFIEALARLKARRGADGFRITGLLVGSDQGREAYRRELEEQISEKGLGGDVQIVGHCEDMPAAYMLSDVVVSASTDPEAFGRVIAEAQAMGRPVVVADHGGATEQVLAGETGWLFTPGDPETFADALEEALTLNVEQRETLAVRASAHVRENYSKAGMCADTLRVYAALHEPRAR